MANTDTNDKPDTDKKYTFFTVRAGNIKDGTTKNGNPYLNVGLVIKSGPRKGQWLNYMIFITPKNKERVKRDLEIMGVNTDGDGYTMAGTLCTAVWGYSDFFKEERVIAVRQSKFNPDLIDSSSGDEKVVF